MDIEKVINSVISLLVNSGTEVTEESIDNYIDMLRNPMMFKLILNGNGFFTEEEIDKISRGIRARLNHALIKSNRVVKKHIDPWFKKRLETLTLDYWKRYKQYLIDIKGFSPSVVETMDDVTDVMTDLLGDPEAADFERRGLIIGDVQSGKTSNFIGLICKAADAGYKLIVILTGTDNNLRTQTQIRIDEGLIGLDSDAILLNKTITKVGVGNYNANISTNRVINVTSRSKDFDKNRATSLGLSLDQTSVPIVFVIKKNVSVLNNLIGWLKGLNQVDATGKINNSLLLIDDEADYASINTNKPDCDPTKTNKLIMQLLSLFRKTSYVGFTATPYANVFIDPDVRDEELDTAPLFPKDYIYCLNSPSNYIGARDIFGEDGAFTNCLRTIESDLGEDNSEDSIHYILPLKHKKEADFYELPFSLKVAIRTFFLANAIRDLRGDEKTHRTMIVNISRFVMVQGKIEMVLYEYVNILKRAIQFYSKEDDWKNNPELQSLYKCFEKEYKAICDKDNITWDDIRSALYKSICDIETRVINNTHSARLNYNEYPNGLRVIVVGGISLSRGLTLEGLIVSYFFRNSTAYDTLMQMGRWFGYRDGYNDLFRIWMTDTVQEWFTHINEATEELRNELGRYHDAGLTPKDFGIRVRKDSELLITARNKMRSAEDTFVSCIINGTVIETPYLYLDKNVMISNYNATKQLVEKMDLENLKFENSPSDEDGTSKGYREVDWSEIVYYLSQLEVPLANSKYEKEAICDFISSNKDKLGKWDIAFIQGSGTNIDLPSQVITSTVNRQMNIKEGTNLIRINGRNCRLGSPGDGNFGLKKEIKELALCRKKEHNSEAEKLSQKDYFSLCTDKERRPLLMIYLLNSEEINVAKINDEIVDKKSEAKLIELADAVNHIPFVAFGLGIPDYGAKPMYVKYSVNKIGQALEQLDLIFDDGNGDENDD